MVSSRRILPVLCALAMLAVWILPVHESEAGFSLREKLGKRKAERSPSIIPLSLDSFAGSFRVSGREGAVLSLELPGAVYSRLVRDDFRDICVFDATGTPVPFTLASSRDDRQNAAADVDVIPFFPWPEKKKEPEQSSTVTQPPSAMDVEIDTKGGIIRIRGNVQTTGQADEQTDGAPNSPTIPPQPATTVPPDKILLDLGEFSDTIPQHFTRQEMRTAKLLLKTLDNRNFASSVALSGSDDLASWRTLHSPQPLIRLAQGEYTVERLDIDLPVPCPRYLMLRFSGDVPQIRAVSGKAEYGRRVAPSRETRLPGLLSKGGRSVEYTLAGAYPLYAINFISRQADFMPVRLESTSRLSDKHWKILFTGVIYSLEKNGVTVSNEPFPLSRIPGTHLRLQGTWDVPFVSAPDMLISWRPHTLLFLARGQGPWTVAYGRAEPVSASTFLPAEFETGEPAVILVEDSNVEAGVDKTGSGKDKTAAGATSAPGHSEDSSSAVILWAALLFAVLVLSGIAVYLFRSAEKKDSQ